MREQIEGCLEIVNKCPCNPISCAKGKWELTLGYQLSCGLSKKWFCNLKKKKKMPKALKLKDHQSSFLMTAGHSQLEKRSWKVEIGWPSHLKDIFLLLFWNVLLLYRLMISAQFRWYRSILVKLFFNSGIFNSTFKIKK